MTALTINKTAAPSADPETISDGAAALVMMRRSAADKRGVASLCIGGGEATAMALECA